MDRANALEIMLVVVFGVAPWAVIVRIAWRAGEPARLLLAGRYREARASAERLGSSWMRILPNMRASTGYVVACALHLEGNLDASLFALASLSTPPPGDLRRAMSALEAANLVLLDRDHERAVALLDEASAGAHGPDDRLLLSLAKLALGETERAAELFMAAKREHLTDGVRRRDLRQREAIFHTLRGLYLARVGRTAEAERDFEIAANSSVKSEYVVRARAMLDAREAAPEDGDGPSSLEPQVLGKDDAQA